MFSELNNDNQSIYEHAKRQGILKACLEALQLLPKAKISASYQIVG